MDAAEDPMTSRARVRIGQTLCGKWHLDFLLGVGGMAAVYRATHRNGKEAAVKILHPEISVNTGVRERFLREGYAANRVKQDGAVSVLDDDMAEDGSAFLVMELLEGETLESRRERKGGKLPPTEVLSLADQVLDTLAAAHAQGIVHRDLKPENLFLTRNGRVKVLDFGIARLQELSSSASATQTGSMMGTPAFMPPEQARGRWNEVDGRTDLWALGASMFTLLTGRYVHDGETVNEVLAQAITQPAASIATADPDLPTAVIELVDRSLAYEKDNRWSDAKAMQEALRVAYHSIDGATAGAPRASIPDLASGPTFAASPELVAHITGNPSPAMSVVGVAASSSGSAEQRPRARLAVVAALGVVICAGTIVTVRALSHSPTMEHSSSATSAPPPAVHAPEEIRPTMAAERPAAASALGTIADHSPGVAPAAAVPSARATAPEHGSMTDKTAAARQPARAGSRAAVQPLLVDLTTPETLGATTKASATPGAKSKPAGDILMRRR